jgi:hypothetical protein
MDSERNVIARPGWDIPSGDSLDRMREQSLEVVGHRMFWRSRNNDRSDLKSLV